MSSRVGSGLVVALLLAACSGATPAPVDPLPDEPVVGGPGAPDPETPDEGSGSSSSVLQVNAGEAVPIQLRFTTVGSLHQGFFGRENLVRQLGKGLGQCTDHTVEVDVVWSQKDLEGRIIAQVPDKTSICVPRTVDATRIDLRPLVPTTKTLAAYRDGVAGFSDFRIANFVVAADLRDEGITCRFRASGQHPPDGTRFHPCVEVNGERICARGKASEGVEELVFDDPAAARKVSRCL